jgi:hypothetical protein
MPPFKINIFYASLLILASLLLMADARMEIISFWKYAPFLLACFGLILFPITKSLKKQSDTAQIASMLITGTVGAIALTMLMKVQRLSQVSEPMLIGLTLVSFIVVGIYLGSLKRS